MMELIRAIKASCEPAKNINTSTQIIVSKSAITGTSPSEKISFTDSISLIVLVVSVPTGVLSKLSKI